MIKMYGFWRSAASFRVRMAMNLKNISYEETMINLDTGEQHKEEYLCVNTQAVVPSLIVDDGPPLTQSMAILEYLEELYPDPPLLPKDARGRQRVRSLSQIFVADHHPLIVPRIRSFLTGTLGLPAETRDAWLRHWFREGMVNGEKKLADDPATGRFCHGDTLTIADLCMLSHALATRHYKIDFSDLPVISRIVENCLGVDAIARAVPLKQPGAPSGH
ncbi:MAG TPA: maleylacetoacetate isomerase [Stellaceae bacterium]|jgi:maleylacetoacetate isomerase|nr:maleylacetoacetate isomerase [Stellaceae bacterium]